MRSLSRISDAVKGDLEKFKAELGRYLDGEFSDRTFQALRVPRGIYEQRTDRTFMVRVRIPGGGLYPDQLRQIASISEEFGNGIVHLTTRQDVQIHYVKIGDIGQVMELLLEAGLSSKGGGGNTVRNVTACERAGVCPNEAFDVTPHAVALTECLIDQPDSFNLPRKFKTAFSGCSQDCAIATINDLGFIAREKDGRKGFTVYAGGGMGTHPCTSERLEEFVPAEEIGAVATAVKRLFDRLGDRKNRNRARLRFVMEKLGKEQFRSLYREELERVKKEGVGRLELRPIELHVPQVEHGDEKTKGDPSFLRWRSFNVRPQKQPGYFAATITVPLGNISAEQIEGLAAIAEEFGEGMLRTTRDQNLVLRWVPGSILPSLYGKLGDLELEGPSDSTDVVSCPGADTCRLGICLSRNLTQTVQSELRPYKKKVSIRINGCPNACGQHLVSQIGLQGEAKRIDGHLAPYYKIHLGGRVEEGKTVFGSPVGEIPVKDVPTFLNRFLALYDSESPDDFYQFLQTGGWRAAEALVREFSRRGFAESVPADFVDCGAAEPFSLAGRGPGECGAGLLALIEEDLLEAENALRKAEKSSAPAETLHAGLVAAARALLVVRGVDAMTPRETFDMFTEHFIGTGLVDSRFLDLFRLASERREALPGVIDDLRAFVARIRTLYQSLDIATLEFRL